MTHSLKSCMINESFTKGVAPPLVKFQVNFKSKNTDAIQHNISKENKNSTTNENNYKINSSNSFNHTVFGQCFSKQQSMFESADSKNFSQAPFYLSWNAHKKPDGGWARNYFYCQSLQDFLKLKIPLKDRSCQELLRENHPVVPSWDVEWYSYDDHPSPGPNAVLDKLKYYINITCKNLWSKPVDESHYRITQSHKSYQGKQKFSFHINLRGYGYFPNHHLYSKLLCQSLIEHIGQDPVLNACFNNQETPVAKLPIDTSIYSKNRCFRLIGHHKGDEPDRILTTIESHKHYPLHDYVISYVNDEQPLDLAPMQLLVKTVVKQFKQSNASRLPTGKPIGKSLVDKIVGLFLQFHEDTTYTGSKQINQYLTMHEFTKSNESCLLCHRVHKNNRQYLVYNSQSKNICYKCFDESAADKMLYLSYKSKPKIKVNQLVNQERVPSYNFHGKKCLIIESPVGTSKTRGHPVKPRYFESGKYIKLD